MTDRAPTREELVERLRAVHAKAANRWDEWGERAVAVADALDQFTEAFNAYLDSLSQPSDDAEIRACIGCGCKFPDFTVSSRMKCWTCRSQPSERLDAIAAIVWGFAEDDGADPIVGKVQELYDCYREASEKLAALSQPTDAALRESIEYLGKLPVVKEAHIHVRRVCDAAARAIHADGEEAGEKIANYLDAAGQPGHAQVVREGWGIGSAARAKGEG